MTLALDKVNGTYKFKVSSPFLAVTYVVKQRLLLQLHVINNFVHTSLQFHVMVGSLAEGLYSLKFHYCQNRLPGNKLPYSFTVSQSVLRQSM